MQYAPTVLPEKKSRSGRVLRWDTKNGLPLGDAMGWEVENVVRLIVSWLWDMKNVPRFRVPV